MPQNRKKQLNKLLRASPIYQIGEPLFQAGKKAGENLAETVLGPPDYSPVRAGRAGYNKYGTPLPKGSVDEFAEEAIDEFSPPDFGDISPEEQQVRNAWRYKRKDALAFWRRLVALDGHGSLFGGGGWGPLRLRQFRQDFRMGIGIGRCQDFWGFALPL